MFARPRSAVPQKSLGPQQRPTFNDSHQAAHSSNSVSKIGIDAELRKSFREKREARLAEFQARLKAQREQKHPNQSQKSVINQPKPVKRPPVVKQTLASKLRMEKANPLLTLSPNRKMLLDTLRNQNGEPANKPNGNAVAVSDAQPSTSRDNYVKKNTGAIPKISISRPPNPKNTFKSKSEMKPAPKDTFRSAIVKKESATSSTVNIRKKDPLRRSLTTVHLKKLGSDAAKKCIKTSSILKSRSAENVSTANNVLSIPTPVMEETRRTVKFSTPLKEIDISRMSFASTPAPADLRYKMQKWLEKTGKDLGSYPHLRCFGIHQSTPYRSQSSQLVKVDNHEALNGIDEDNKENRVETMNLTFNESGIYKITDISNMTTNEDVFGLPDPKKSKEELIDVANDVLNDLLSLIRDKYPREQSKAWLQALKAKYPHIVEQPLYWECKAALEEVNGDLTSAVECYQRAIVHGAEENKIDRALEDMLEKFSILNLDSSRVTSNNDIDKHRRKMVCDARNVFKSSVIKFAVQQRLNKKLKLENTPMKFTVTPVRRSTRKSRTSYASTSNVQLYDSIREISSPIKGSMTFECNSALADGL